MEDVSIRNLIGQKASIRMITGSDMNQFTGITDMPYQNIDKDLSHYFNQSEQLETYIETNLAINKENTVLYSYAMFAQLLPGAPQHLLSEMKERIITSSSFLAKLKGMDRIQIQEELRNYFSDLEIIGQVPVQFSCGCSKEMYYGMLNSLDEKELMTYIYANEIIKSSCHNCGRTYQFYPTEIKPLLRKEE